MDTSPDSDGDDAKVAKHSHRWQPPKANAFTASASETNQHTPSAASEHDNHEFQQTHAAEAARHQVAQLRQHTDMPDLSGAKLASRAGTAPPAEP